MIDLRDHWNFDDPDGSEARFRALLDAEENDSIRIEIEAQVARTFSLRKRFADAHGVLDRVLPRLEFASSRARASYELERGRTFNSSGHPDDARLNFLAAAEIGEIDQRIDALHMLAIVSEPDEAISLNEQALDLARESGDRRA